MELANAFYIIGIICMSLITVILIALIAVAVLVKIKIDHIHRAIEARVQPVREFAKAAEHMARKAKEKFGN
ncbi:MAG TPA: hypothetical protein VIM31_00080 [Candidatus Microsaccharimonas sp.]|jgi:hypothetical protein